MHKTKFNEPPTVRDDMFEVAREEIWSQLGQPSGVGVGVQMASCVSGMKEAQLSRINNRHQLQQGDLRLACDIVDDHEHVERIIMPRKLEKREAIR